LLYASSFSGFYLPLMIVLWLLMLRGIGIELRSHMKNPVRMGFFDVVFSISSILLCILFGAALGNVIRSVPLGSDGYFFEPLWANFRAGANPGILDWYTILTGVIALVTLTEHGSLYVICCRENRRRVESRARLVAQWVWPLQFVQTILGLVATGYVRPTVLDNADMSVARSGPTLRHTEWRDELFKTGLRGKSGNKIDFSRVEPLGGTRWLSHGRIARSRKRRRCNSGACNPAKTGQYPSARVFDTGRDGGHLASIHRAHWCGRRDYALLLTMYNLGARVSEISGLRQSHVTFGAKSYVQLHGKGQKDRSIPPWPRTARVLRDWFRELGEPEPAMSFPSIRGERLTRFAIHLLLRKVVGQASARCATLKKKRVSPHIVRHGTAMALLQSGVDIAVIALWLGHESIETTNAYLHANLAMKERALAKILPVGTPFRRFQANDTLFAFLESL
jgi:integrase